MKPPQRLFVTALLVAGLAPAVAGAQDTTRTDRWLSAFSIGFPSFEGEMAAMLFTVGGNFTKIRPGSLTPDFSIGTMPYALAMGIIPWATRAGLALPMQHSNGTLIIPSAGVSAIIAMSGSGGGAVVGSNVGIALASRSGARVGVTWHRIADAETIMLLEFGVGRLK